MGAPPAKWSLVRSVALASLVPFFLLSLGHYYSLTLVLVDDLFTRGGAYRSVGGRFFLVSGDGTTDALICTVLVIVAVSFVLLCLSMVATIFASAATSSGRRLALRESLAKVRGLWREPSVARLYFTILFLGYVLSLLATVVVTLVVEAGGSLGLGTRFLLLSLLALLLSLYLGVLGSVGLGFFVPGEGECRVETLWSAAVDLTEEMKLQGFVIFFLLLVVTHGLFLIGQRFWGESFYVVELSAIQLSSLPLLMSVLWMLGACGLFGYVGVLLQV